MASPEPRRARRAAVVAAAGGARAGVAVDVQCAVRAWAPSRVRLGSWVRAAVGRAGAGREVALRVVGAAESRRLNRSWRDQDHATNVLSFPAPAASPGVPRARAPAAARVAAAPRSLGDLVICAPVLAREAREQGKTRVAHWAHLVVHGSLHLVGFDHERAADARRMERRERRILADLGFPDPYADHRQGKA